MTAPFSMTEQFSLSLPAGGELTSRGQTLVFSTGTNGIPEPSTWAMVAIGFAGLGFAAYRGRRRSPVSIG